MLYVLYKDPTTQLLIGDKDILQKDTSLPITVWGQDYTGDYGNKFQDNLYSLLENFNSGSTMPKPIVGALWYDDKNYNPPILKIYTSYNRWKKIQFAGDTAGFITFSGSRYEGSTLTANLNDPNNPRDISWAWTYNNGTPTSDGSITTHSVLSPTQIGKYVATATYKDDFSANPIHVSGTVIIEKEPGDNLGNITFSGPTYDPIDNTSVNNTPITANLHDVDTPIVQTKWVWTYAPNDTVELGSQNLTESSTLTPQYGTALYTVTATYRDSFNTIKAVSATNSVKIIKDNNGQVSVTGDKVTTKPLTAKLSDADNPQLPVDWNWTVDGKPATDTFTTGDKTSTITPSTAGNYIASATYNDSFNKNTTTTATSSVIPVKEIPVDKPGTVTVSATKAGEPATATLSDADTIIGDVKWTWTDPNGQPVTGATGTGTTSTLPNPTLKGTYTAVASYKDSFHPTTEIQVLGSGFNKADDPGKVTVKGNVTGQPVTATLADVDQITSNITWKWITPDGTNITDMTAPDVKTSTVPSSKVEGEYKVTASYTDEFGSTITNVATKSIASSRVDEPGKVEMYGTVTQSPLTATLTDDDGPTALGWNWTVDGNPVTDQVVSTGLTSVINTPTIAGNYVATASYKDSYHPNTKLDAVGTFNLPPAPVDTIGTVSVVGTITGKPITATLKETDNIKSNIVWAWVKPDGSTYNDVSANSIRTSTIVNPTKEGEYKVTATYTDDFGICTSPVAAVTIDVAGVDKAGTVTVTGTETGQPISAVLDEADKISSNITWAWVKPDGTTFTDITPSNIKTSTITNPSAPGNYKVTASYTDDYGDHTTPVSAAKIAAAKGDDVGMLTVSGTIATKPLTAALTEINPISGNIVWNWQQPNGQTYIDTTTQNVKTSIFANPPDEGIYKVTASYADSFGSHVTSVVDTTIGPPPVDEPGTVTVVGTTTGKAITATLTDPDTPKTTKWQWTVDGKAVTDITTDTTLTSTIANPTLPGKYVATATYSDGFHPKTNISVPGTVDIKQAPTDSPGKIVFTGTMKSNGTLTATLTDIDRGTNAIEWEWLLPNGTTQKFNTSPGLASNFSSLTPPLIAGNYTVVAKYADAFNPGSISVAATTPIETSDNLGVISITGDKKVNTILTATLTDLNITNQLIDWNWTRGTAKIPVASTPSAGTMNSITPVISDMYTVTASYNDSANPTTPVTVSAVVKIAYTTQNSDGSLTILGGGTNNYAEVNTKLVADLKDSDGPTNISYSWYNMDGAAATPVFTGNGDAGKYYTPKDGGLYSVTATYNDAFNPAGGASIMLVSDNKIRVKSDEPGVITLTGNTGSKVTIGQAVIATLTDADLTTNTGVVYKWYDADYGTVVSNNNTYTPTKKGQWYATAKYTDMYNPSGVTVTGDLVSADSLPPTITMSKPISQNSMLSATFQSAELANTAITFEWMGPSNVAVGKAHDHTTSSSGKATCGVTPVPSTAIIGDTYTVSATYTDSTGTYTITDSAQVTPNATNDVAGKVTFTDTLTSTTVSTCQVGTPLQAVLADPDQSNSTNWQWYSGANAIAGETTDSYTPTVVGTYSAKASYNDLYHTGNTATATGSVTVTAAAVGTVAISSQTSKVGDPMTAKLAKPGATNVTYDWRFNGTSISPPETSDTYTPLVAGTYSATASYNDSLNPNTKVTTAASNSLSIAMPPAGTVSITSQTNKTGDPMTAKLTATSASNIVYDWQLNGVSMSPAVTSDTYTPLIAGGYTATATYNDNAHPTAPITTVASNKLTITVPPAGTVTLTSANSKAGEPITAKLSTANTTNLVYDWQLNGVSITPAVTGDTYTPSVAGKYTATATYNDTSHPTTPVKTAVSNTITVAPDTVGVIKYYDNTGKQLTSPLLAYAGDSITAKLVDKDVDPAAVITWSWLNTVTNETYTGSPVTTNPKNDGRLVATATYIDPYHPDGVTVSDVDSIKLAIRGKPTLVFQDPLTPGQLMNATFNGTGLPNQTIKFRWYDSNGDYILTPVSQETFHDHLLPSAGSNYSITCNVSTAPTGSYNGEVYKVSVEYTDLDGNSQIIWDQNVVTNSTKTTEAQITIDGVGSFTGVVSAGAADLNTKLTAAMKGIPPSDTNPSTYQWYTSTNTKVAGETSSSFSTSTEDTYYCIISHALPGSVSKDYKTPTVQIFKDNPGVWEITSGLNPDDKFIPGVKLTYTFNDPDILDNAVAGTVDISVAWYSNLNATTPFVTTPVTIVDTSLGDPSMSGECTPPLGSKTIFAVATYKNDGTIPGTSKSPTYEVADDTAGSATIVYTGAKYAMTSSGESTYDWDMYGVGGKTVLTAQLQETDVPTAITYQWAKRQEGNQPDFVNIPGATSASYTPPVSVDFEYRYRVDILYYDAFTVAPKVKNIVSAASILFPTDVSATITQSADNKIRVTPSGYFTLGGNGYNWMVTDDKGVTTPYDYTPMSAVGVEGQDWDRGQAWILPYKAVTAKSYSVDSTFSNSAFKEDTGKLTTNALTVGVFGVDVKGKVAITGGTDETGVITATVTDLNKVTNTPTYTWIFTPLGSSNSTLLPTTTNSITKPPAGEYTVTASYTDGFNGSKTLSVMSAPYTVTATKPVLGEQWHGGTYCGTMTDDTGQKWHIIVAPLSTATQLPWAWNNVDAASTPATLGPAVTDALAPLWNTDVNKARFPAHAYCANLTSGGYSDWYLPTFYEFEYLYYHFKPGSWFNAETRTNPYDSLQARVKCGYNPYDGRPYPGGDVFTKIAPPASQWNVGLPMMPQQSTHGAPLASTGIYWTAQISANMTAQAIGVSMVDGEFANYAKYGSGNVFNTHFIVHPIRREKVI